MSSLVPEQSLPEKVVTDSVLVVSAMAGAAVAMVNIAVKAVMAVMGCIVRTGCDVELDVVLDSGSLEDRY